MLSDVVERLRGLDEGPERDQLLQRSLDALPDGELSSALKAESERYLTVDTHVALRLAEALIFVAAVAGRPEDLALGLMRKADALRFLGGYRESLGLFEEAGRAFLAQGNEVGWARTRIGWLVSSHLVGNGAEALDVAGQARDVFLRHHEWFRAAGLALNTAAVCQWLGRYDQALQLYEEALDLYGRAGQVQPALQQAAELQSAMVKTSAAEVLTLRGDFRSALALSEEAQAVFVRQGDTLSVLRSWQYIADVYAGQGYYTRALRLYGDAVAALERAGQDPDVAWLALGMIECYLRLNLNVEALELAEETATRFERCQTPTESARARLYCALASARLGEIAGAQSLLTEVAQTFAGARMIGFLGIVTLERARLYLDAEDWASALATAREGRGIFARLRLVVPLAQANLIAGHAALALGRLDDAAELARSALTTIRGHDLRWLVHEGHQVLAGVAQARGALRQALAEYQVAIASIEQVQGHLATELRTSFLEDKLRVYQGAVDCCLRLAEPDLAFEYLERAKSRALVDYLARNPEVRLRLPDGADQELLDELSRLRGEHNWLYNRLYGYGLARRPASEREGEAGDALTGAEAEPLRAAIRKLEKRIARVMERLALRQADGLEAIAAAPSEPHPTRPALDDRVVLLEYYFGRAGGALFVLSGDGLSVAPLTAGAAEVQRLLSLWQLNLDATALAIASREPLIDLGRHARSVLEALYRALLQPAEPYLAGRERVVVVPYGPTHAVPFQALHDGHSYLLEAVEVSACPSSGLLKLCASRRRRTELSALVIANSAGGRLPHVLTEARAVAALLPGECYLEEQATISALVEAASRFGVVHLAAHGEARLDNPTFAHLKLADGQLSAADVFNLELNGALVTLSACETGRSLVAPGDELIGLSRGFLYAGASTLVQSLWRVDDGSTATLMDGFYRALSEGKPSGAALREAQLAALDARGVHPCFWAAFQLVGDPGWL